MHVKSRQPFGLAAVAAAVLAIPAAGLALEAGSASLSQHLVNAASAFNVYVDRASALNGGFTNGQSVSDALVVGAAYQIDQLEEGEVSYGALIALQDPAFVRGVQRAAPDEESARQLLDALLDDPRAVLRIDGAAGAAALTASALRNQAEDIGRAGRLVKQAAYDLQRQPWSKETVPDAAVRLARVKALSAARSTASPDETARLMRAALDMRGSAAGRSYAPTPMVTRSLALAVAALTGQAGDADTSRIAPLLREPSSSTCLKMAKLNLYQCLAVAGPHYEDMFCLGQHALIDTGKCVSNAAGAEAPVSVPPPPATTLASISVPAATD